MELTAHADLGSLEASWRGFRLVAGMVKATASHSNDAVHQRPAHNSCSVNPERQRPAGQLKTATAALATPGSATDGAEMATAAN